jgi:hypothetical protein
LGLLLLILAAISKTPWIQGLINGIVPVGLTLGLLVACIRLVRCDRINLFKPITAFLFACAFYYGIGPLLYSFGSQEQITLSKAFVDFGSGEITQVLILNQVCILAVVLAYLGFSMVRGSPGHIQGHNVEADPRLIPFMAALAGWALAIKFLVVLPWDLKLTTQAPSGMLVGTQALSYGTLFYLWYLIGKGQGRTGLTLLLMVGDLTYGLISLSKMALLLPLIAALLGYQAARPLRFRSWMLFAGFGTALLMVLQPMNTYLRYRRDSAGVVHVRDLLDVLSASVNAESLRELDNLRKTGVQQDTFITRLSYVNVEVFVMAKRNEGRKGNTYRYFKDLFIPRFLWPDKPVVNPGLDFNKEWLGSDDSAVGLTLFGEAFFEFGWWGVPLVGLVLAGMLKILELPIAWVLGRGHFEQSMLLFLGIFVGLRVDDWAIMLVSSMISGGMMAAVLFILWRLWPKFSYTKTGVHF